MAESSQAPHRPSKDGTAESSQAPRNANPIQEASRPMSQTANAPQPDPLLSAIECANYLGVCRATFWADVQKARMPQPYYINARRPRWRRSELDAAIAAAGRIATVGRRAA